MNATSIKDAKRWRQLAQDADILTGAWVDGGARDAATEPAVPVVDPSTGDTIAGVPTAGAELVDEAVRSARRAFEQGSWANLAPRSRGTVLRRIADVLTTRRESLAALLVREVGKPIRDALDEVDSSAKAFAFYGEAVDKVYGQVAPTDPNLLALVTREPMGVVAAVTPWNYPLLMSTWKVAPALAAGNSVILKPAEQAPLATLLLGPMATDAGLPDGVLNVLPGRGEVTGAALGLHPEIDAVTFTGSTEIGKRFLGYSGRSNMKAVSLECGGKSPFIVLPDIDDLPRLAQVAAEAIFGNAGQNCNAGSRLLVHRDAHYDVVGAVVDAAAAWSPGDPFDPDTRLGALVDGEHFDRVSGYVDQARTAGADLATGGRRAREDTGGWFHEPTVFADVDPALPVAREEVFGPVLTTFAFSDTDEAIRLAHDTTYGLAAGIWSRDIAAAHQTARRLRAGAVYVNCYDAGELSVPFGGFKESGIGVDKSLMALDKFSHVKSTLVDLS